VRERGGRSKAATRASCTCSIALDVKRVVSAATSRRARCGEARAWLNAHLAKIDAGAFTEACMLWPFGVNGKGYPCIGDRCRSKQVTRVIVEHLIGLALATDDVVCHTCDTPRCVNPAHFFRGDDAANVADMVRKGRQPRGDTNGRARLTADDVRAMRATYTGRYGEVTALARHHGVNVTTITDALRGRSWGSLA
jgi:hypothetical protein